MKKISIDIESFSDVDLIKCGVYRYAASEAFEILLFGYSVDDGDVQVVDVARGEKIPDGILRALSDESVIKWAFNANFERICLSYWLRRNYPKYFKSYTAEEDPAHSYLDPVSWRCSMVLSLYNGLPRSLEGVGAVLRFDAQKLKEGKDLIRYFCVPCAPTKSNGERTRNRPEDAPEKWELFKKYNKRDVEVEMQIQKRLEKYPVPDFVWDEYHLDQQINDRGVRIDMALVENAIKFDERSRNELMISMQDTTGLDNPNSVQQLRQWLSENGLELDSLGKKEVAAAMKDAPEDIQRVLALRLQIAKSSIKKYQAMKDVVNADGRARGTFLFYGASRTGRWSGSKIQLQNLVQNHMSDLAEARELVRVGDFETMELLYDSIPSALSELIRTALVPRPGYKFIVADFSAIEARVVAYLAGEQWVSDVFARGGDIYCATAEKMFHVPVKKHGINSHLRQKGKQCVLSCSYGGSVGAMKAMGAIESGMKEEELQPLVDAWREANPNIVSLWWNMDGCVKRTITERIETETNGIRFSYRSGMLFMHLPSGRALAYVKPRIGENKFGGESITYEGTGSTKKWERLESYGPKFVENCLAEDTLVLTNQGLVPIQNITAEMLIWDGEEWVSHEGLIYQGKKEVISVDGIRMTPEHKILTEKGWMESGKTEGLNWAAVSLPDCFTTRRKQQSRKGAMVMQMCMWKRGHCRFKASEEQENSDKILWMHEKKTVIRMQENTWYESSSGLGCMALNEAALSGSKPQSLSQLWRTRHHSMRSVAGKFRELLGRYGPHVEKGIRSGSDRQQCRIHPGKLSLDPSSSKLFEQKKYTPGTDLSGGSSCSSCFKVNGDKRDHHSLSIRPWVAGGITIRETRLQKRVYDIRNCGPRHRFTVWNGKRLCIVSNCVQAVSRDILCESMKRLGRYRIVGHVHDEVIIECPMDTKVETICEIMGRSPDWMPGILLRADGYETPFYKKD